MTVRSAVPAYVGVETARLVRRSRAWVLLAATAAIVVLFGFVLVSAVADLAASDPGLSESARRQLEDRVAATGPASLPETVSQVALQFVPLLGLLTGVVVLADDYRRGYLKFLVARGVPRRELVLSKLAAAGVFAVLATAVVAGSAVAASVVAAGVGGSGPDLGAAVLVLLATGTAWWLWACIGVLLTVVARSAVAAVVLAAVLLVAGSALAALPARDDVLGTVAGWLPLGLTSRALEAAAEPELAGQALGSIGGVVVTTVLCCLAAVRLAVRQDLR